MKKYGFFDIFTSIFQAEHNRSIDNYSDIYISQMEAFRVRDVGPIISVFVLIKFSFVLIKRRNDFFLMTLGLI